jgi:hypothetical protein
VTFKFRQLNTHLTLPLHRQCQAPPQCSRHDLSLTIASWLKNPPHLFNSGLGVQNDSRRVRGLVCRVSCLRGTHTSCPRFRVILYLLALTLVQATPPIAATNLRTEYLVEPPNIDTPAPRFYWQPQHADRGQFQTSYTVVVTNPTGKTVWNSGKVASSASAHVIYNGTALTSNTCYSWTVAWADSTGAWAPVSAPATFCTGLLTQAEWVSDWITCPQAPSECIDRAVYRPGGGGGLVRDIGWCV